MNEKILSGNGKCAGVLPGLFATCSVCASVVETFIGLCWVVECLVFYGLFPM